MKRKWLTVDADAETDGPFGVGDFAILVRVAVAREVLGAALGTHHFADEASQDAELAPVQIAVAVLVQLIEFPLDHTSLDGLRHRIHLHLR